MSFAQLERYILDQMSATHLPSVSMAVVQGNEVIWSRGFGLADIASGQPANPDTIYAIASITKSFTAIAVLQLAEQGKLSLDDAIEKHLPSFNLRPGGESVRIKHFLSHTSGIPALASSESMLEYAAGARDHWLPLASYDDFLAFISDAQEWTLNKPGERWYYLNEGYALLGAIIEKCSGVPYGEYIQQQILEPLGMTRSFFHKADVESAGNVATPYSITSEGKPIPARYPYRPVKPGGEMLSTAHDLARYLSMYLNQGEGNGARILSTESLTAMQTPYINTPAQDSPFGQAGYGYGLHIVPDFMGQRLVGHGGSIGICTSYIGFLQEKNLGVAVVVNGSGTPTMNMSMAALAAAIGEDLGQLPFIQQARLLDELSGTYATYKGTMTRTVKHTGDYLTIIAQDKHTYVRTPLLPETLGEKSRTFYALQNGSKMPVEFRVDDDGQVSLIYERYLLRKTGD